MKNQSEHDARELLAQIDPQAVPAHIAVIMDGNGRWAQKRKLARIKGHVAGAKIIRRLTDTAARLGVKVLTLYCFSTENWRRPAEEVSFLMKLLQSYLNEQAEDMVRLGVHLSVIGDISALPDGVREEFERVMALTAGCDTITLNLAVNYGARDEILRAAKNLAAEAARGELDPETIDEKCFGDHLFSAGLPDPDLLIRTSGEIRLSNFLLWQAAYSELYFVDINWPDFDDAAFYRAIIEYQHRNRRFGGVKNISPTK